MCSQLLTSRWQAESFIIYLQGPILWCRAALKVWSSDRQLSITWGKVEMLPYWPPWGQGPVICILISFLDDSSIHDSLGTGVVADKQVKLNLEWGTSKHKQIKYVCTKSEFIFYSSRKPGKHVLFVFTSYLFEYFQKSHYIWKWALGLFPCIPRIFQCVLSSLRTHTLLRSGYGGHG